MPRPEHLDAINMLTKHLGIQTRNELEDIRQEANRCLSLLQEMLETVERGGNTSEEDARTAMSFLSKISHAALSASTSILIRLRDTG